MASNRNWYCSHNKYSLPSPSAPPPPPPPHTVTTAPYPVEERISLRTWSSVSSFNFQNPLISLRLSSSCSHLLPRLPVPYIFPSIMCFRRQFLHNIRPIQLAFLHFTVCRIFLSSYDSMSHFFISHTIGPTDILHFSPAPHFKTIQIFSDVSKFRHHIKLHSEYSISTVCSLIFKGRYYNNYRPVAQSVEQLPTGWTVRGSNPGRARLYARSDQPWGPTSLLYNGYQVFPGGKVRPGRAANHSLPSSAVVMEG